MDQPNEKVADIIESVSLFVLSASVISLEQSNYREQVFVEVAMATEKGLEAFAFEHNKKVIYAMDFVQTVELI